MKMYKIKNWERYQHYSKRNPPWVKLHFELLASADWVALSDASRVLAIACMLLASRNDGKVPDNPEYLKRVAYLNGEPDFRQLLACGFLVDASNLNDDASVSASASVSESVSKDRGVGKGNPEAKANGVLKAYPEEVRAVAIKAAHAYQLRRYGEIMHKENWYPVLLREVATVFEIQSNMAEALGMFLVVCESAPTLELPGDATFSEIAIASGIKQTKEQRKKNQTATDKGHDAKMLLAAKKQLAYARSINQSEKDFLDYGNIPREWKLKALELENKGAA